VRCVSHLTRGLTLFLALIVAGLAAEARKNFDVSAGDAVAALKQYSAQAGVQLLYSTEELAGVRTAAVKGEHTAREALNAMLKDTGLVATADGKTGAFAVKRDAGPNAERAVPPSGNRPGQSLKIEEGIVKMEQVEVTGSRIRSQLGEAGVSPVMSFTRGDLERYGVNQLGMLQRLIPQLAPTIGLQGALSGGFFFAPGRAQFDLRALGGLTTLVLIDGRRVSRSNQSGGNDAYNLDGIPFAAIERVEVLTEGASAVYGADAIGGVINVILRRDFTGGEFSVNYDNTFDTDAGITTVSLTGGLRRGALSVLGSVSWEKGNALWSRDRWWRATNNRTIWGGLDGRSGTPDGRGLVTSATGAILPGAGASTVTIPAGANGTNNTVATYVAAGALPGVLDEALYSTLIDDYTRRSAFLRANYEWTRWIELFVDARGYEQTNHRYHTPPAISNLTIPAGYAGNPFGVPLRLSKVFWEFGPQRGEQVVQDFGLTVGAQGRFGQSWRYKADLSLARAPFEITDEVGTFGGPGQISAVNNAAAAVRPVVLHDSTAGAANPAGTLEPFMLRGPTGERPSVYTYSLQADGNLWSLPAGELAVAAGGELREEYTDIYTDPVAATAPLTVRNKRSRSVHAAFAELSVPVFSAPNRISFVERLEFKLAVRVDDYSDAGQATSPRYGVIYRPKPWLALRASHSEGFRPGLLRDYFAGQLSVNTNFTATGLNNAFDPVRNEQLLGLIRVNSGGNPALRPETSVSRNLGVVIEPPWVPGLTFSADYYDIDYTDKIAQPTPNEVVNYFPGSITRAATADGSPGRISIIDRQYRNIAGVFTRGWDYHLSYRRATGAGEFILDAKHTDPGEWWQNATLTAAPRFTPQPKRGVYSLFWNRQRWGAGVTARYQSGFDRFGAYPSTMEWDVQVSHDLRAQGAEAAGWFGRLFSGTRWSATVSNAFNAGPTLADAASTRVVQDPRLRRFILNFQKHF